MSDFGDLEELIDHLVRTSRLSAGEAARVLNDVLTYLAETPETFIRRRHYLLQREGLSNPEIFEQVAAELSQWRFRAPPYTARQIRRIIYG